MEENLKIPAHVALILDGNGRWAKKRGLPRQLGHKKGCETLEQVVEDAARLGIRYLTVYGFSTENWKRPEEEVGALMQLFRPHDRRERPFCVGYRRCDQCSGRKDKKKHRNDLCDRRKLRKPR